jgi:hypothetical protein
MFNYAFLKLSSQKWSMDNMKKDMNIIRAWKMKFMQRTAGYTRLDHKSNQDILDKQKV